MDLEWLDRLEDKVDSCVAVMRDLRAENDELRTGTKDLERRIESLTRDAKAGTASKETAQELRARCAELERKLDRARARIESVVDRIRTLEG